MAATGIPVVIIVRVRIRRFAPIGVEEMTVSIATLGFPRIGPRRELKFALEDYWSGRIGAAALAEAAEGLRTAAWTRQHALGVDHLPSNDFSLYDHVLDTSAMLGAVPERYGFTGGAVGLDTYFAMARGVAGEGGGEFGAGITALEMTKWFDTNYHYMVPELRPGQTLRLASTKPLEEYLEAKAQGFETRPTLLGPVTWLSLAKGKGTEPLDFLDEVLAIYLEVLGRLRAAGAEWVQIDEPCFVLDLSERQRAALTCAYARLASAGVKLMLTTYFGALGNNLELTLSLPIAGLHVDLARAPEQLDDLLAKDRLRCSFRSA